MRYVRDAGAALFCAFFLCFSVWAVAADYRPYTATQNIRWKGYGVEYESADKKWNAASRYFIAEKDGQLTNPSGEIVEFTKGDLVFEIAKLGYYKAIPPARTSPLSVPNPEHVFMTGEEVEVVDLTNRHRARNGVRTPLRVSSSLMSSSRNWAYQMATRVGFQHMPGAAENIGWNYPNSSAVMTGWINSPGHNANLLRGYTQIGIGHVHPYWSQQFR